MYKYRSNLVIHFQKKKGLTELANPKCYHKTVSEDNQFATRMSIFVENPKEIYTRWQVFALDANGAAADGCAPPDDFAAQVDDFQGELLLARIR